MKWLKRSALGLLALALLALAAVSAAYWAIGTDSGTAWLVQRLVARAPQISIARVGGSLLFGLRLEGIRMRTARDELDIDRLELDWNAPALLIGELSFARADATRAAYRRVPGASAPGGGPPQLPWPLRIDEGSVAELSITILERTLVFEGATFAGLYGDRRLALRDVAATYGTAALTADATFELADEIVLDVAGTWAAPVAGVASSGNVELDGTWPVLAIRHALTAPFAATSTGTLTAAPFGVDLVNEWQNLAWPGVDEVASPSGRLTFVGTHEDYRYEGSGTVVALGRSAAFTAEGTGQRLSLALARLELAPEAPGGGALVGAGGVDLARRETSLDVTASGFDPAWIVGAWPGRLDGTARLRASLDPEPTAALDAVALSGELRGYPVTLGGAAAVTGGDRYRLDALRLDSGSNRVVLTGALDRERLDLAVDAQLDELDLLVPDAVGGLTAALKVGGTWQDARGSGKVELRRAAYAGVSLDRLDIRGSAGLAADAPVDLTIEAAGVERTPLRIRALDARIAGTAGAHTATLAVSAADVSATAAATGAFDTAGMWRATLDRLEVDEQVLGPWRLEAPASLALGRGLLTVATTCLRHVSNARWCTELDLKGRPEDSLVVSGQNFDLATLRPLLPAEVQLAGVYQLSGSLFDLMGDPRGAVALTGGKTSARIALSDEQTFATELDLVQAGMTLTNGRLALTAAVRRSAGGSADVDAEIADVRTRDSRVGGMVRVEWPDVGFLALLSPELEQVAGAVAVDLDIGGTVAEPTLDGRAAFSNGRVAIPRWGLVVDGIEATATSEAGRSLDIAATGRAGDGVLTVAGTTQLDPEAGWPTELRLRGDTVRVVQLPDVEIFASPDLRVVLALPLVDVTGSVHIPRATLALDVLPSQAVTPSPDAVIHGIERTTRSQPLQLKTGIAFTLGDDVRYSGLNLDTTVTGELRVATEPDASVNATGTLRLDGTYDAYGQKLDLERGQLLFSGPVDNPGLDVRAVRTPDSVDTVDRVEVGVELTGTLKEPRTRVFATPAMSEADALSYLLFGRPVSGNNAAMGTEETSTLQTAALTLGLQQALPVVQRFGNSLGLDELTVQSTATDAGALMAGKYLSPRVYIRYSYGLFNRIGGFLLRFRVNDRLSIETRSGDAESMDLFYTVEKD